MNTINLASFRPLLTGLLIFVSYLLQGQAFVHPGIDMNRADLEFMKRQVSLGKQPWKDSFIQLQKDSPLDFDIKTFAHIIRGPYGKPNIGADDLRKGANKSYDFALLWYITGNKQYAQKSKEIINQWSESVWDFDDNDAKLLAGWTGYLFCNAAEILRYTDSVWSEKDTDSFSRMLMTVYFPLLRFYFPEANGNWDGAIIRSLMAIAVFTDNRTLFDNAASHFLRAPVNGSLFKYIYPNGQCQESTRDQGHVQLGLGEFAGAAQIAYSQGIDLFAVGNNRLALGFEYTASYLLGCQPFSYGEISARAKDLRDYYEPVYQHYASRGIELPFVKMAADSLRGKGSRSVLTAYRYSHIQPSAKKGEKLLPSSIGYPAGALQQPKIKPGADAIVVMAGESVQTAVDLGAATGRPVLLSSGMHRIDTTLILPSNIQLGGEGISTILFFDLPVTVFRAIVNGSNELQNICMHDMVIEGALSPDAGTDPNGPRSSRYLRNAAKRAGISFLSDHEYGIRNIEFVNLTVRNFTRNGVIISGANNLKMIQCDFSDNGSGVIPGYRLHHNLLITHTTKILIRDSRFDTSPHGCGIAIEKSNQIHVENNEIARNGWAGIRLAECTDVVINDNLVEANDGGGIISEFQYKGCLNLGIFNNQIQYNGRYGIETYNTGNLKLRTNTSIGNGEQKEQNLISSDSTVLLDKSTY